MLDEVKDKSVIKIMSWLVEKKKILTKCQGGKYYAFRGSFEVCRRPKEMTSKGVSLGI